MNKTRKVLPALAVAAFLFAVLFVACVKTKVEAAGGDWYFDENGFWYCYYDNTYPYSQWLEIDGKWYYFEATGYMAHDKYVDGYWLGSDGAWTDPPKSDDKEDKKDDKDDKEKDEWEKKKADKAEVIEVNVNEKWAKIQLINGEVYLAKNLELSEKLKSDYYPGLTDEQVLKAEAYVEYMASDIKGQNLKTDMEKLDYVALYIALWTVFSKNDQARQGESIANTPYGFFVDNAFNDKGALKSEERMLHYIGYDDFTENTLSDGKKYLDVKVSDGIIRLDFYKGSANYL